MHHLLYIFDQDVWDVLLHASRQGPEDCCVWPWLTEQRWKSGWDGHRSGEQTPVSFQALLWPASDLLCVSMCCYSTASAVLWMYQDVGQGILWFIFVSWRQSHNIYNVVAAQGSISGETSWSRRRYCRTWPEWEASLLHASREMEARSLSQEKNTTCTISVLPLSNTVELYWYLNDYVLM